MSNSESIFSVFFSCLVEGNVRNMSKYIKSHYSMIDYIVRSNWMEELPHIIHQKTHIRCIQQCNESESNFHQDRKKAHAILIMVLVVIAFDINENVSIIVKTYFKWKKIIKCRQYNLNHILVQRFRFYGLIIEPFWWFFLYSQVLLTCTDKNKSSILNLI